MLFQKRPNRSPSLLILLVGESAVSGARYRDQLIWHFCRFQRLVQAHRLLVGDERVFVAMNRNDWRIIPVYVIDRGNTLCNLIRIPLVSQPEDGIPLGVRTMQFI